MSHHSATLEWQRSTGDFVYETYDRAHSIDFGPGIRVAGTAARGNIPPDAPHLPGVDPEQSFVASLSACHMLWFLHLACQARWLVDSYTDNANGTLEKRADGKMAMTRVTLRPKVLFGGNSKPDTAAVAALHHQAHEHCFIANSVLTEIRVEPQG